jgi:hypothetical protein
MQQEFERVLAVIQDYFDGLHYGDVKKLDSIFHADAVLKAPNVRRTKQEWLAAVGSRPVPAEQGLTYAFNVLSVEIIKDQAMVKVECPLFEYLYVDYLGLLKENQKWLIVNKMYTDISVDNDSLGKQG